MKLLCFLISFTCITAQLKAQSIGLPHISNYSILDYRGGSQNWDIQQDHKGILYFANNEGLLTFNGGYWKLYPLPNRTIVRSVRLARNGRVYVGGQDELGYFFPDNNGTLQYTSLKPLIPKSERQFSDVWNIADDGRQMIFRTTDRIMCLKDGKMAVFKPASSWEFAGTANGRIIVQDLTQGLMVMNGGHLDLLCADPKIKGAVVSAVLPYRDDTLLVVTLKNGLFLLKDRNLIKKSSSAESLLVNSRIFRAIQVNRDHYALGTTSAALVIIDRNGDVVQRFTSADGLQKDNVRSIFVDRDKNLWVGLDNGIDYLAYNSAIKTIFPDPERQVSAYSTIVHGRDLYIGTSNGVFTCPLDYSRKDLSYSNGRFQEVRNTGGQVWSLSEVNGRLVMGHEDGAFVIDGTAASPVYQRLGTWLFQPLSPVYPSAQVIAGTYEGLESLSFDGNRFQDKGHIGNIVEPLRFLVYDPEFNTLWSSHPYRGIFRFVLSADKKRVVRTFLYSQKDGLPLTLYNYVFYVKNRIVVSTARGVFEFDYRRNRFRKSAFFEKALKATTIEYMREDTEGNVWFVSDKKIGVVDFSRKSKDGNFAVVYFPELSSKIVAGFVNVYPYNKNNIFIGGNQGVFHINYEKYAQKLEKPRVLLGQVRLAGDKDSVIFGGYFIENGALKDRQAVVPALSYRYNSLHFEYASTLFEHRDNTEYSYQLVGFDKDWSAWSPRSEKDYTNLPAGSYTFRVKARNNLGSESDPVNYSFKIEPAWYNTYWMYGVYLCLAGGGLFFLAKRQQKKHEEEQRNLIYQHQLALERNEKKIVRLQNEKLEADVLYKNKELATTTMHLVQRGKLLSRIREELLPVIQDGQERPSNDNIKRVLRLLDESDRGDSDWQHFSIHFDQVHSNFLSVLKERFPQLSSNDLKLCAYLKMNLTTKEMAQLMNITIRAVEVSRYRLRKKINVPTEVSLFDFLIGVTGQEGASSNKSHEPANKGNL